MNIPFEMPKPNQEHQRLHALIGEWVGEEKEGRVTFRGHGLFSYDTQTNEFCRYTYRFESERLHHLRLESCFDGGKTFATFMEATYRKVDEVGA